MVTKTYGWKDLKKLPLFRPARRIEGEIRKTSLGFGKPILKFGDGCKSGHNTFSITVDGGERFGGCCHDLVREVWPEYSHLIKWHLVSTDGPLHYLANTLFHMKEGNLEYARSSAVAPNATEEQLSDEQWLRSRLPGLMDEFARVMKDTFGEGQ